MDEPISFGGRQPAFTKAQIQRRLMERQEQFGERLHELLTKHQTPNPPWVINQDGTIICPSEEALARYRNESIARAMIVVTRLLLEVAFEPPPAEGQPEPPVSGR